MFNIIVSFALAVEISLFILAKRIYTETLEEEKYLDYLKEKEGFTKKERLFLIGNLLKHIFIISLFALSVLAQIIISIKSIFMFGITFFALYIIVGVIIPCISDSNAIKKVCTLFRIGMLLYIFFSYRY